ncbi:MAG: MBL fold metallo-hydrolase [Candidatus Hodarchaeales archaeon]|jgi:7,8-dihydropterin-6-yl-methyl-4-(beta-D-ribofuranosyl)aminobenzene 5'-phosphate synthase
MSIQRLEIEILVDNIAGSFSGGTLGEHGFSALSKVQFSDSELIILFDTGPSPVAFLNNIKKLEVDLTTIDAIVLSHGHLDHIGGLKEAVALTKKRVPVICHPQTVSPKYLTEKGKKKDVGFQKIFESIDDLKKQAHLITKSTSHKFTNTVMTTGEVPRRNDYEVLSGDLPDVTTVKNGKSIPDMLEDDLSMVFQFADDSIVILAGCCHAGIVNTVTKAEELTGSSNIVGIVGGLHIRDASHDRLTQTTQELMKYPIKGIAPCHCTGFRGKYALSSAFGKRFLDVSVSSKIKFENSIMIFNEK